MREGEGQLHLGYFTGWAEARIEAGESMEKQKAGCPRCGKPTAGSPTEKGFRWAYCDDCLKKMEGEKAVEPPPAGEDSQE